MDEEAIYTERDMQIARATVNLLKRELANAKNIIWCIIKASGGEVKIPQTVLIAAQQCEIERNDTFEGDIVFRCM